MAVLVITADRGMAGAYTANALREAERLRERMLEAEGHEIVQYAAGRRAVSYYTFRHRELAGQWTGGSDAPSHTTAKRDRRGALASVHGAGRRRAASASCTSSSRTSRRW